MWGMCIFRVPARRRGVQLGVITKCAELFAKTLPVTTRNFFAELTPLASSIADQQMVRLNDLVLVCAPIIVVMHEKKGLI